MTTNSTSLAGALASRSAMKAPAPAVTAAEAASSTPGGDEEEDYDWESKAILRRQPGRACQQGRATSTTHTTARPPATPKPAKSAVRPAPG
jgi:hypothetical protein